MRFLVMNRIIVSLYILLSTWIFSSINFGYYIILHTRDLEKKSIAALLRFDLRPVYF